MATLCLARAGAVELDQMAGVAHAYPAMLDAAGKKLGNGEFIQELKDDLLRIRITYDLTNGGRIEEVAVFRQKPELIQEEWSWREWKEGKLEREYRVNFGSGSAAARKGEKGEQSSDQLEIEQGRTFAGFGFTLALENLRPRLVEGEQIELKAVGFTPKGRVVTVKASYQGTDRMKMSGRLLRGENFLVQPQIPAIAKLFIRVPDTHIWLTPPPAGFLRWEGPFVEPSDPIVRVDLASGGESGPAKAIGR